MARDYQTAYSSLGGVGNVADLQTKTFLLSVQSILDVGLGRAGNIEDSFVKRRDLIGGVFAADGKIHLESLAVDELIVGENIYIGNGVIHIEDHIAGGDQIVLENDSITRLINRTLDYISDTVNYSRVRTTDISAGHVKLASCIASDNSVHVNISDLAAGRIQLVNAAGVSTDLDLDGIKDGAEFSRVSATYISGGRIVLVRDENQGIDIQDFVNGSYLTNGKYHLGQIYQNGQTLVLSSGNIKFSAANVCVVDATGGLVINAAGGLQVNSGYDIQFNGSISSPSKIVWAGANYNINMGAKYTGNYLAFWPSVANECWFYVGYNAEGNTPRAFEFISLNSSYECQILQSDGYGNCQVLMRGGDIQLDGTEELTFQGFDNITLDYLGNLNIVRKLTCTDIDMDSGAVITSSGTIDIDAGGSYVRFYNNGMRPETTNTKVCGHASYLWSAVYATAYYDNGGGYNDGWRNPETGATEEIDDLGIIKAMGTTGQVDERTGQLKINHAKSHPILFARHHEDRVEWDDNGHVLSSHKKGSVIRDDDDQPLYNIATRTGLAFGAIRQLDAKIETILQVLMDNNLLANDQHHIKEH